MNYYRPNEFELLPELETALNEEYQTFYNSEALVKQPFYRQYQRNYEEPIQHETFDVSSKDFQENYIDNFVQFQMMTPDSTPGNHFFKIFFANGKEKKFNINDIPAHIPAKQTFNGMTLYRAYIGPSEPEGYGRDDIGLIYPVQDGSMTLRNERFIPNLVNTKTKIVIYQGYLKLMQITAAFASIVSMNKGATLTRLKVPQPQRQLQKIVKSRP